MKLTSKGLEKFETKEELRKHLNDFMFNSGEQDDDFADTAYRFMHGNNQLDLLANYDEEKEETIDFSYEEFLEMWHDAVDELKECEIKEA